MSAKEQLKEVLAEHAEERAPEEPSTDAAELAANTAKLEDAIATIKEAAQDPATAAALRTLIGATAEADPKSEVDEIEIDYEFLNYDPTDFVPHFERLGMTPEAIAEVTTKFVFRWCNTKQVMWDRRMAEGWLPFKVPPRTDKDGNAMGGTGGTIQRGDVMCCFMPVALAEERKRQLELRRKLREEAPMRTFEQETSKYTRSGNFETFDDASGPRLRGR